MTAARNSNSTALTEKVAKIASGEVEDSLNVAEVILYVCQHRKIGDVYSPMNASQFSATVMNSSSYLADFMKDLKNGKVSRASNKFAARLANISGENIDFWKRERFSLAEAQSIQFTMPNEIKPQATIEPPETHSRGVVSPEMLAARELAKLVLFPKDLTSTTIAKRMKQGLSPNTDIER